MRRTFVPPEGAAQLVTEIARMAGKKATHRVRPLFMAQNVLPRSIVRSVLFGIYETYDKAFPYLVEICVWFFALEILATLGEVFSDKPATTTGSGSLPTGTAVNIMSWFRQRVTREKHWAHNLLVLAACDAGIVIRRKIFVSPSLDSIISPDIAR
jgi:hypothetical protein